MGGSADTSRLLTPHGVQQLCQDDRGLSSVRLQVLGIYRYLMDPLFLERVKGAFVGATDVFDVLLSDGHHKIKAVLAPVLYPLVWKRELTARSLVLISKFHVLSEDPQDHRKRQRVVVIEELSVTSVGDEQKLLLGSDAPLQFISTVHPREVELLPLLGGRRYYLPLQSDHYPLDWACSFTGGVPDEDSPLDELERNWARRYGSPDVDEQNATSAVVAWNGEPEFCTNLLTSRCKRLRPIAEILVQVTDEVESGTRHRAHPPMVGVIRVKSKVMHVGESELENPFPFVFNAVVVDRTNMFEVAFFGSMCAKYYLSLQEGDLVQFSGYSAISPHKLHFTVSTTPLFFYQHESSGTALHVPKKYWKALEMINLAPHMIEGSDSISQNGQRADRFGGLQLQRPSWLECCFVNILNTQYWSEKHKILDVVYFDFVGVLSNVGKICRGRKRGLDEDFPEVTQFRWVKMIDSSSSNELVIRVSECSQPAVFRSLEAGNTLMITKLQWVMQPANKSKSKRIEYATTTLHSVLRMNEAILPFQSVEECNLNVFFADNVKKNVAIVSNKFTGESKLGAHIEKKYGPRNRLPVDADEFKEMFGLDVCSFSDLSELLLRMEAFEHQHVGFVGRISSINNDNDPITDGPSILLELSDSSDAGQILTVAVNINPLYHKPVIKGSVKSITPPESLVLIRLLPADLVDEIYAQALRESQTQHEHEKPELSLEFIEHLLTTSKRKYFFSLQIYQNGSGDVSWEVDAILAVR